MEPSQKLYHHPLKLPQNTSSHLWEQTNTIPFQELIISWNASRPSIGFFTISTSIYTNGWSEWLPYVSWGSHTQSGGNTTTPTIKIKEDTLEVLEQQASGFRIRINAHDGADLHTLHALHACISRPTELVPNFSPLVSSSSTTISVQGLSQMLLAHPRHHDLCSPTSVTCVVRHLLNSSSIDPIQNALQSHDAAFNIFGNWVLNVAHAGTLLGEKWHCWVQRLKGFEDIYEQLKRQIPVIVSVKGPLVGSATPYLFGHLMVIRGYNTENRRVLCMDPAFRSNEATLTSYPFHDFVEAWSRRGNIAYMFEESSSIENDLVG